MASFSLCSESHLANSAFGSEELAPLPRIAAIELGATEAIAMIIAATISESIYPPNMNFVKDY